MTRAVQTLIKYAFENLKLVRLLINCRTGNQRSSAIPKRLGFTLEGTERLGEKHGQEFFDFENYNLLFSDRK